MTDDEITAAQALCDAATPAPWTADVWIETDGNGWRATGPHHESDAHDHGSEPGCPDEQAAQRDADFIAASRSLVPQVLTAISTARDANRNGERVCAGLVAERDALAARVAAKDKELNAAERVAGQCRGIIHVATGEFNDHCKCAGFVRRDPEAT